jgi:hypothetical protein
VETKWQDAISDLIIIILLNGTVVLPLMLADDGLWCWHYTGGFSSKLHMEFLYHN